MSVASVSILFSVLRSATFEIITSTVLAVVIILLLTIKATRSWGAVKTILNGAVFASAVLVATVFSSKVQDAYGARAGYSSSYDPNDFAYVLIGFLPLVVTFVIVSKGAKRLLYFATACVMTAAILLTQSRGGFIGLLFEIVAMTFALPVAWRGQLRFQTSRSRILARVVLLALIGVVGWHSLPENTRVRLESVTQLESDYNANASESGPYAGRLAIWARNLPLALNRPWGYGAGAFETVDGRFGGGRFRASHNTFLQALIELGLPGFALFIAVILSSLRYLHAPIDMGPENTTLPRDEPRAFARALGIGLVGLCISGFFLSELYANVFWTLVTLSCAVGIIRRTPLGAHDISPPTP
jgi:O-antigen ligase